MPRIKIEDLPVLEDLTQWLSKSEMKTRDLTMSQVCVHFWRYAKKKYGHTGKGKYGAAINWRPMMRVVREHYGRRRVSDFGPKWGSMSNRTPRRGQVFQYG